MVSLRAYQEELKKLIFVREQEPTDSRLWEKTIPSRLDVYRNNTRTNWTDTLDHDFPLTRAQFSATDWGALRKRYFILHPPQHWELNTSMSPFVQFLKRQPVASYIKELADYEWADLQTFIQRAIVKKGLGTTNPTLTVHVYQFQIFNWVEAGAPAKYPPQQKPEVLVFYRDSRNTIHIEEADPLMLMMIEHFRKPQAKLDDLEPLRARLLPANKIPLEKVRQALQKSEILL